MAMEEILPSITLSDVLEHSFCPRFTYFMHCLCIPQHEEQRFKVLQGRDVHRDKTRVNAGYLRKKLHVVHKEVNVFLSSPRYRIKGIVDEVLFLEDNTAAPLEYKFAEFKERIFRTYRNQLALQAILIMENYQREVNRGFICFTRSRHHVEEVCLSERDFARALSVVEEILEIIDRGFFPMSVTNVENKCIDCCYRNICA